MNIFDNISKSPTDNFLSKWQQPQPVVPPKAPMTDSYVAPPVQQPQKPTMTLFSNEKKVFDAMINDGISEDQAYGLVKQHRASLLPENTKLTDIEATALKAMANDGIRSQDAINLLLQSRDQKAKKAQEAHDNLPWYDKLGLATVGAGMGALSTVGSSAENIAGWTAKKLGAEGLGNELQANAKEWDKANQTNLQDPNFSAGTQAGNIMGGTAMMLAAPSVGGGAKTMLGKVVGGATTGGLQMGATDIANTGETSAKSVAGGAALGGLMPIAGKVIDKAGQYITERLPKTLIAKGMTTPTALKNASERLSKLSDDGIVNIEDAPQWMLDKGLKGSKDEIQGQLQNVIKNAQKSKAEMFASNTATYGKEQVVKDLKGAIDELIPLYMKGDKVRAGAEQIVKSMKSLAATKNPTLAQIDDMRSILGEHNLFKMSGDMADEVSKKGLQKIWIDASKFIENQVPGFRAANKDIEVAMALKKAIGLKEAQDATRSLLTLPNIILGGGGGYLGYQQGGAEGAIKGLAGGALIGGGSMIAKNILNNPKYTTGAAQLLKNVKLPNVLKKGISGGVKKILIPSIGAGK